MRKVLEQAVNEIRHHRREIIDRLKDFAKTDLLFFWGEKRDLFLQQQEKWLPILDWASTELRTELNKTETLDVPDNSAMQNPLTEILVGMTDKELACFYAAALNMRSVLLALALVKHRVSAEEAYELSYLEEMWQNEKWGTDAEAVCQREERLAELKEIESFLAE